MENLSRRGALGQGRMDRLTEEEAQEALLRTGRMRRLAEDDDEGDPDESGEYGESPKKKGKKSEKGKGKDNGEDEDDNEPDDDEDDLEESSSSVSLVLALDDEGELVTMFEGLSLDAELDFSDCPVGLLEAMKKVVRDGEVVMVPVRRKKKRLTPAQRAALKKAQAKAHMGGAERERARSLKVRDSKGIEDDGK